MYIQGNQLELGLLQNGIRRVVIYATGGWGGVVEGLLDLFFFGKRL